MQNNKDNNISTMLELELHWLRQQKEETEVNIQKQEKLLRHLKLDKEATIVEIGRMEKKLVEERKPLNKSHCPCGKEAPEHQRLVTSGGSVYCLACGYEILDLLKTRNEKKEREHQPYKEFYEDVKKKANATL